MVLINRCFDQLNMWCPAHGKPCRAQRLFAGQAGFWRCDLRRNRCRSLGCRSHSFPAILLLMLSMCVPAICETGQSCSWLNAASAAGVLQGPVTATVTHTSKNKDDATCEFIRRDGSVVTELQIEVETMRDRASDFASYRALCGPNAAPLRAIGNEALVCSLHGNKHNVSEQIVSRVRDRAFIVRIRSNAPWPAQSELREKAQKVAEQVAGVLF